VRRPPASEDPTAELIRDEWIWNCKLRCCGGREATAPTTLWRLTSSTARLRHSSRSIAPMADHVGRAAELDIPPLELAEGEVVHMLISDLALEDAEQALILDPRDVSDFLKRAVGLDAARTVDKERRENLAQSHENLYREPGRGPRRRSWKPGLNIPECRRAFRPSFRLRLARLS
jgi:hypothetical protein